jgi:hypothetical protein
VVEDGIELVDGVWPKRVSHLWTVESDAYGANLLCSVVRDIGEIEPRDRFPLGGIKDVGNVVGTHQPSAASSPAIL